MLKSYLKIAFRSFRKHKGHTFINVFGLAVGIAVCALILLWVRDELAYDRFHEKSDRIYRVLWDARFGNNEWTLARTPIPLADVLKEQIPEVERVVRFTTATRTLRLDQSWVNENAVLQVEPAFFEVFSIPFISGSSETALTGPGSVVLTREAALRYFGHRDPMGRTLEVNNGEQLQVTGVVESLPPQSHFRFDFLLPLDVTTRPEWQRTSWGTPPVYTYFLVREGTTGSEVQAKLQDFIEGAMAGEAAFTDENNYYKLPVQRLTDIHLRSHVDAELAPNGNILFIYVFSAVGVFILLLACVNFINLATARAANRGMEVGIRKALGSNRSQLVRQFLAESSVYVALALVAAMVLMELALPAFNTFSGKQLATDYLGSPFTIAVVLGLALAVTFLAGAYPAVVLASFRPVLTLKESTTSTRGRDWLRSGLVVGQFCISIILIAGTLVARDQVQYAQEKQLGFDKEHVLVLESAQALGSQHLAFRERIESHPLVAATSATQSLPGRDFDSMVFEPEQPAGFDQSSLNYNWVDAGIVDVLGLQIVQGRNFSSEIASDSTAFLINESAAALLGWEDPIGKNLSSGGSETGPVVGVLEDFHYESLHEQIEPIVFPFVRWTPSLIAVRLRSGNVSQGVAAVREAWEEFVPQRPFTYSFLDQDYEKLYRSEQQIARVFGVFSALALFIACLGLFGLASYVAVQRTKEIGIRKVLGASARSITLLLTREFAAFVLIAFLVAVPLSYLGIREWLAGFAYRVDVGPELFLAAGGIALAVAMAAVSYQAFQASRANPVESLRYE